MAKTIYLQFDEEVLSAVQKISRTPGDQIILAVPKGAKIFKTLTGLKLVKREAEKRGKTLTVATADERGQILLERAGIAQSNSLPGGDNKPTKTLGKRTAMGDIRMASSVRPKAVAAAATAAMAPEEELQNLIGPSAEHEPIQIPQKVKVPHLPFKYTLYPFLAATAIFAALAIFVLPSVEVKITPRTEPITRDLEIQIDGKATAPDIQNLVIPGKVVSSEYTDTKTYPATGTKNVGEKASGFVTIYNFSKNSLILKSATTKLEAGGKTFYFLQDVGSIRPTARIGKDLEIDQSSLIDPVPIVAAEAGEEYNLPAGTRFEVKNEIFGHQPDVLYAVNGNPIAGGSSKQVKIVSGGDIEQARKNLTESFAEKLRQEMKDKASPESRLADNAFTSQVLEEKLSQAIGAEAESFSITQKAKLTALVYSENDVRDLIVERIVRLLPENKYLASSGDQGLSAQFVSLDLSGGVGTLRAHFESEVRYQINTDFLGRSLPGKTATEVKEILLARPEIQEVEVNLSPFWVKTVPRFSNKVSFKVVNQ